MASQERIQRAVLQKDRCLYDMHVGGNAVFDGLEKGEEKRT